MKELCGGGGKTNYIDWSCMCHKTLSLIEEWKCFGSTTLHTTTIDMQIVGSNQLEVWKQSENASSTVSQKFVTMIKLWLPSTKVTFLVKIHCKKH
jgi:hypothetical protein